MEQARMPSANKFLLQSQILLGPAKLADKIETTRRPSRKGENLTKSVI